MINEYNIILYILTYFFSVISTDYTMKQTSVSLPLPEIPKDDSGQTPVSSPRQPMVFDALKYMDYGVYSSAVNGSPLNQIQLTEDDLRPFEECFSMSNKPLSQEEKINVYFEAKDKYETGTGPKQSLTQYFKEVIAEQNHQRINTAIENSLINNGLTLAIGETPSPDFNERKSKLIADIRKDFDEARCANINAYQNKMQAEKKEAERIATENQRKEAARLAEENKERVKRGLWRQMMTLATKHLPKIIPGLKLEPVDNRMSSVSYDRTLNQNWSKIKSLWTRKTKITFGLITFLIAAFFFTYIFFYSGALYDARDYGTQQTFYPNHVDMINEQTIYNYLVLHRRLLNPADYSTIRQFIQGKPYSTNHNWDTILKDDIFGVQIGPNKFRRKISFNNLVELMKKDPENCSCASFYGAPVHLVKYQDHIIAGPCFFQSTEWVSTHTKTHPFGYLYYDVPVDGHVKFTDVKDGESKRAPVTGPLATCVSMCLSSLGVKSRDMDCTPSFLNWNPFV
jgi:hypothetical protein